MKKKKNRTSVDKHGTKYWRRDGQLHRRDAPAIERHDGSKFWYFYGQLHREEGPAIEYPGNYVAWYYKGEYLGCNAEGFWTLWKKLTPKQQNNLNLHQWLTKYT